MFGSTRRSRAAGAPSAHAASSMPEIGCLLTLITHLGHLRRNGLQVRIRTWCDRAAGRWIKCRCTPDFAYLVSMRVQDKMRRRRQARRRAQACQPKQHINLAFLSWCTTSSCTKLIADEHLSSHLTHLRRRGEVQL